MTKTYFPFDSGGVSELQWRYMSSMWQQSGVLASVSDYSLSSSNNGLQVFGDSSGMQVKVRAGAAYVEGHFFRSDAQETVAVSAADPTNPRKDRLVLRIDFANNTIDFVVKAGTPAGSPTRPTLQQDSTYWEIALATIDVAALATTIAAGNVTDERVFAGIRNTVNFIIGDGSVVPSTGVKGWIYLPKHCKTLIVGWRLSGSPSGSMVLDLWHDTDYDSATDADALPGGGNEPTLSSDTEAEDTDLSNWTTVMVEGGCLVVNLDSASTMTQATLALDLVFIPTKLNIT